MSAVALALALLMSPAFRVEAQARLRSALEPGVRVRYLLPGSSQHFTGQLERADSTNLIIRPDGIGQPLTLGHVTVRRECVQALQGIATSCLFQPGSGSQYRGTELDT